MGRVVVVGSANLDVVLHTSRLPAPGETVAGLDLARHPGGKGLNQAVAAARSGAATEFVGRVGDDDAGRLLRAMLVAAGVDVTHLAVVPDAPSGTAVVVVDEAGENLIVVVAGANDRLAPSDVVDLGVAAGDVVVVQREVPAATVAAALRAARAAGAMTVLNAAPADAAAADLLADVDVLVVNETESALLTGQPGDTWSQASRLRHAGPRAVVVTLGGDGAIAVDAQGLHHVPGRRVDVVDTTGAGDCFTGVLAASLATDGDLGVALDRANRAAALSTTRHGAAPAMPTAAELAS